MALRTAREARGGVLDWVYRPMEWVSAITARLSGAMNQERWTLAVTVVAVIVANLIILNFFLKGQENRAMAFVVLALVAPLALLIAELSVAIFIVAGSGLFVNTFYYAVGPGLGTGQRTFILLFLAVLSARAVYEYLRTPAEQRPRILSWFLLIYLTFYGFYMLHVAYIYFFNYHTVRPDERMEVLGLYKPSIIRYFDAHMLWIGIIPIIVLMRDLQRAKRILFIVGAITFLGAGSIMWDYFAPLPEFWKVAFQLQAAGEEAEGYRIREPAAMYLITMGLFTALYSLGYYRGWKTVVGVLFVLFAAYALMVTKNRALWAGAFACLPFALFWKPVPALARQTWIISLTLIVVSAFMLHPLINFKVMRIVSEAIQRWERNYAFGGDFRNDPSYQARLREKEAWEVRMSRLTPFQQLFGAGLEEPYGRYVSLYDAGYRNPRFLNLYIERVEMHFPWLARQLHIGLVGTGLLIFVLIAFFIRAAQAFFATRDPFVRSLIVGVIGGTVSLIAFDMLHSDLFDNIISLPVILLWSVSELTFHWKRTGQLQEPDAQPTG